MWVRKVPALDGREGTRIPLLLSLTPTQDKSKGQVLSVVYSTCYKQLKFRREKKSSWRPRAGAVTGCRMRVRHFPGAASRGGTDAGSEETGPGGLQGGRPAPQQDDSGGKTDAPATPTWSRGRGRG